MIDMRGGHAAEQHTHAHRRIRIPEHIAHIGEHPPGLAIDHHEFHGAARALALPSRRSSRARPCIILLSPSPIHWPARNAPAVLCTSTIHIFLTPTSTGTIRPLFAGSRAVKRIAALGRELLATHDAGFLRSASWLIGSRVVNSLATSIAANEEAQTLRLVIDEDRPIATTARQCRIPWSSESPLRALRRTLLAACTS